MQSKLGPVKKKLKKDNDLKSENTKITENNGNKFVISLNQCSTNWKKIEKNLVKEHKTTKSDKKIFNPKEQNLENNKKKNEIWFDVDHIFIPREEEEEKFEKISNIIENGLNETNGIENNVNNKNNVIKTTAKLTKAIAIDCEMVGVGDDGRDSILARVSLVNQLNQCVYDKFVLPTETVTDYRTHVSGVRSEDLKKVNGAEKFEIVQKEVAELIKDRILVGHAVHNDLKILFLSHPKKKLRDTQRCKLFRKLKPSLGGLSSLKNLAHSLLGIIIQDGEHSSVQDAQATMRIYTMFRKQWEAEIRNNKSLKDKNVKQEDLVLNQSSIVKRGNDKHKRYVENRIKRRNRPFNFKKK